MNVNLHTLTELGCYVSAGNIDHFDGKKHHRLGIVTPGGDVILDVAGEAYAEKMVTGSFMSALAAEAPVVEMAAPLGMTFAGGGPGNPGQRVDPDQAQAQ